MLDPQLKRGILEVGVLSAVSREDSYGYKIIKDLSGYIELTESTLYPILRRLEAAGDLTVYSVEHNGRLRKFYRITDRGHAAITEFLRDWPEIESMVEYIRVGKE
ncbi:MAG TPA: PadR family transcriptional regulator [Oscillospiraceae bacterium]|nr:PadR family transcriptional regulator [Oscillospiraceae bacterium]HPF55108.1 PadR family transcriptional regulator [Clostridiales bacterium]HPK34574.1 PadR family transcriptional regulator [Oscillospiraceae bacterium]HPR76743.1 PadR family transcriptional regulator [Oscillospiraceae bacterium]